MKKVLVFGTFDLLHQGHRNFLEQARKYGNYLIVVVARDRTVRLLKGKLPINNENERVKQLKDSLLANEIVKGNLANKFLIISKFNPDVICLGYDQHFFTHKLERKLEELGLEKTKIIRLKSFLPSIYKSSILSGLNNI
jgi:FAD synthetase